MSESGKRLDPQDWSEFGQEMHELLDKCLARMQHAGDFPWQPKPKDMAEAVRLERDASAAGSAAAFDHLTNEIMPYATGNTHPRFFGWVHGTGLPVSVGAELVAATMNSNCGGRDHGAIEVERAVTDWLLGLSGMPENASAILTTGTSQATILALSVARNRLFGKDIRKTGLHGLPRVSVYLTQVTHSCVGKALEILGHGSDALRVVPITAKGQMDLDALRQMVSVDRQAGCLPLAVVGTAGSVNTGVFDPLADLAEFCAAENIWFHVDGAFGFWTVLADAPWSGLIEGAAQANSIACDFHKWMSVPYDCGACMIYDRDLHRDTFSSRPAYLASQAEGLAGGDHWYCDYGPELSRGFRALKVWAAVKALGTKAFGEAITDNCRQARLMGELVEASELLELVRPVISNLCCFVPRDGDPNRIAAELQLSGDAVFSTTTLDDRPCLRAAIVNHRTTDADIRAAIHAVEQAVLRAEAGQPVGA